jgi:nitrate/nitrite-specific signal transduction histidine kinase
VAHEERLPVAHEEALYYLVREALANVVKHARATRARVTLVRDTTVRVVVEDDGIGFGAPAGAFTYGLAGMRARGGAGRHAAPGEPTRRRGARGGRASAPGRPRALRASRG